MKYYKTFNDWLALKVTAAVGSMTCAWIFCAISLSALPSVLKQHNIDADVQWIAQTFLQLVLLSVIIVGQNIQSAKHDALAEKVDAVHGATVGDTPTG
jgi:Na+-driven multidrug efflux pump